MALPLVLQRGNPVAQGQIGDFLFFSFHGIHLIKIIKQGENQVRSASWQDRSHLQLLVIHRALEAPLHIANQVFRFLKPMASTALTKYLMVFAV